MAFYFQTFGLTVLLLTGAAYGAVEEQTTIEAGQRSCNRALVEQATQDDAIVGIVAEYS